ncbi:uncharacterized protein LOC130965793 [Arachis stenosperma]|uniref:uncharacterized protein LOC130965793 n=1 Tax=Arachis stenosperma TaxID=217475 RepID=UPI0025AC971A|nr:uncharacterized protein LOC130965793 [Arachis stenosperma]
MEKLFYRIPISVLRNYVKYDLFVIGNDKDLQVLFYCHRQFLNVRTPELLAKLVDVGGVPDGVEDVLRDDDDDDLEPATIADDSDDDTARTTPTDKEEVMLSVKTYSIRCGIEYKVLESDHRKQYEKCKEFDNRADAAVSIKVLHNATETHFDFRPTYRRVWLAKQNVVAQIYGNWEVSYNDLPLWVLGVQITMSGNVVGLRTSPMRVGGQVDESSAYFHRLFWTFSRCIKAFRHCKPLVSVEGTHLYGKYTSTLLVVIAQDGNSNIIPIAFALVEGESAELWSFFQSHLRKHVMSQLSNQLILGRHNGIKAALEALDGRWLSPNVY